MNLAIKIFLKICPLSYIFFSSFNSCFLGTQKNFMPFYAVLLAHFAVPFWMLLPQYSITGSCETNLLGFEFPSSPEYYHKISPPKKAD